MAGVWHKISPIRGFTLIELLIVVAIIAILAAIAVPNFLEAQTRSKVSRCRADIRTLATALESYYVDFNSYPARNTEGENPLSAGSSESRPYFSGFRQLTTPIPYMSSIPLDPFGGSRVGNRDIDWRGPAYGLGTGKAETRVNTGHPDNLVTARLPSNCWMLESDGPDRWDNTSSTISTGNFPWTAAQLNADDLTVAVVPVSDPAVKFPITYLIYDPTNGTVSMGEILRFGGVTPTGAAYDYLWTHASN
jgi:type II secretion system protein G